MFHHTYSLFYKLIQLTYINKVKFFPQKKKKKEKKKEEEDNLLSFKIELFLREFFYLYHYKNIILLFLVPSLKKKFGCI